MKKFLTVLLVIAVMFTFSFGSAFAAQATDTALSKTYAVANVSEVYTAIVNAQLEAEAAVDKAVDAAIKTALSNKTSATLGGALTVTYDQVEKYYNDVVAAKKADIAGEASALSTMVQTALNNASVGYISIDDTAEAGVWTSTALGATVYNVPVKFTTTAAAKDFEAVFKADGTGTKANDLAKDAYAAMVTAKLAEIAAIDETAYIAKDQDAVKTFKQQATTLVTKLGNKVSAETFNFSDVAADTGHNLTALTAEVTSVKTGFAGALGDIYTPAKNEQAASGLLVDALATKTLSADEPTQAAKLAWAKTQITKEFEKDINAEYDNAVADANKELLNESLKGAKADQAKIDAANEAIENAKKEKEAALEISAYLIDKCDDLKLLIVEKKPFADSALRYNGAAGAEQVAWKYSKNCIASPLITVNNGWYGDIKDVVGYVQDARDEAAALKADIAIDGTTAVDVDTLLENAIDKIYKTGESVSVASYTANEVLHTRMHALTGVDCNGAAKTEKTVKISGKEYAVVNEWSNANYEGARKSEVNTIKKETKTAIMAAETVADADAAFLAGLEKYNAVLDKDDKALNQAAKDFRDLKAKYEGALEAELKYALALQVNDKAADEATYLAALKVDLAKAYTTEELTEKYEALSAEVKALKGKTALDAEKKALEERAKAYSNVVVTVADKDALVALRNDIAAFRKLNTRIGASYTILDYGLNNKLTTVMNAEKKAVEDAYKVIDKDGKATLAEAAAVAELRTAVDAYNDGWDAFVDGLEATPGFTKNPLAVAKLATFEAQISAAQVDAFEAAAGKLPADGSDKAALEEAAAMYDALTLCQKVTVGPRYYDKIADLEKLIAVNAIADVESLKITAKSSAKKGSMTIKWSVKGNAEAADGYQVWKSTKKNSGFKKAFTTENLKYKNTKGLKKGTRYYYKVRAYKVVEGETYYSDWSNKAYRVAK